MSKHYVLFFHENPFMCVTAPNEEALSRWIIEWCLKHDIKPVEKEWLIHPIEHVRVEM